MTCLQHQNTAQDIHQIKTE